MVDLATYNKSNPHQLAMHIHQEYTLDISINYNIHSHLDLHEPILIS